MVHITLSHHQLLRFVHEKNDNFYDVQCILINFDQNLLTLVTMFSTIMSFSSSKVTIFFRSNYPLPLILNQVISNGTL